MKTSLKKGKEQRKRHTVYTIYLVSSSALFLVYLQSQLYSWDLWPFSYPEIWLIAFSFLFLFSVLRLLVSLPFLVRSIRKEPQDLSLSIPPALAIMILTIWIFDAGGQYMLLGILTGLYIISGFGFGIYGIQKMRKGQEKEHAGHSEKEVRAMEKTAKFLYFIFIASGVTGLFFSLVSYFPGLDWWPAHAFLDFEMLFTIQLFLMGAGVFRLLYHFYFLLFLFRYGRSHLSLTFPLILLFLGGLLKLLVPGSGISLAAELFYALTATVCGIIGFYTSGGKGDFFKKGHYQSE
ncbi:hypothetical protein [Salinimicrobium sp. TH3]|uniref:hypothetical protein n=1 Tax=Salinimicrobium sp. TH3 TaxID=2997342 RepID=UPI0022739209|nr:hypothetical protein [Salinimicrobium sp. TH3]MCY2685627.1 hypothetical protein [Salinimicrobium sp. TH3]